MSTRATVVLALLVLSAPALAGPKTTAIKKAFRSGDPSTVKAMLKRLEGQLDKKTTATVLKNASRLKTLGVYEQLVGALKTAQGEALEVLIKAYKKEKKGEMRFLVVDALGQAEGAEAEATLATAIEKDKDPPVRVQAARRLGKRFTTTAVDALIGVLTKLEGNPKEQRLVREVNAALSNLTGQEISVAEDWKNYWDSHKNDYTKPKDHEEGTTKTRGTVMDRMKKDRPAELRTLTRMKESELLVIDGNDAVDKVLRVLKLKYKKLKRDEYAEQEFDPEKQVLIFECPGGKHVLDDAGIAKLRKFVALGGYAFCSDWDLQKTLAKAFPNVVTFLGETPREAAGSTDVTIQPFKQTANHPLMRDVFPLNAWEGRSFAWKLHERSHMLNDKKSAVVPLVSCPDIQKYGSTTVAFTFAFTAEGGGRPVTGRRKTKRPPGRVLFVSSHFKDEEGGEGDGYALQQLLLNFILEKQEQRKLWRKLRR